MDPDPAPYPSVFVSGFQDANKKFFCELLIKDKKEKRSRKTVPEIKVFLPSFA
jgi:hypothetical protein